MAGTGGGASRHPAAPDRPAAINKARDAVALPDAIHSLDTSLCEALAKDWRASPAPSELFVQIIPARSRRRPASPGRGRRLPGALPRRLRLRGHRADVHPAGRRGAGAAFRADGEDRRAQRAAQPVDGHERGFRHSDRARRHPCPGRLGDFRRAAQAGLTPDPFSTDVIAGLDPAIHPFLKKRMDARIRSGHDADIRDAPLRESGERQS